MPVADGGAKKKMGRPAASAGKSAAGDPHSSFFAREEDAKHSNRARNGCSRDDAAATLGVGRHEAEALETVFTTEGVPLAQGCREPHLKRGCASLRHIITQLSVWAEQPENKNLSLPIAGMALA
jgi:hypothetical protein